MNEHSFWSGVNNPPLSTLLRQPAGDVTYYGKTFFDKTPSLANYWVGKTSVQFYTYMLTLLTGGCKTKEPLVSVDPSLVTVLNSQGYFSYSLGSIYESQLECVTADINLRRVGTFLFAPVYNLQKAQARPRIWSLSLVPVRNDNGKWEMHAQAIMGHCTVWPMLPYELLGAAIICQLMITNTGLPLASIQWMFQSLVLPAVWPSGWKSVNEDEAVLRLPNAVTAAELLSAEKRLRDSPEVRPSLRIPLDAYNIKYLDTLQSLYKSLPPKVKNDQPAQ